MAPPVPPTWQDHNLFWPMSPIGCGCPFTMVSHVWLFRYSSSSPPFLLTPMKEELTSWQFYRQRCIRILPPVSSVHGVIQYPAPAVGTNRCRNIGKGFISNTTQLPDTGRTPVVYVSPDQPLFIIPVISPWLKKATAKEERFFIGLFLLSTCMPYLNRWWGEVWGQCFWNEFHMLFYFSGFLGYLVMAHYMHTHLTWSRSKRLRTGIALMIIGAVWTIYSFYIQAIPGENLSTPVIEIGWAFCTINCVLLTTGTFLMFSCINQPKSPRLITEISKLSYGMYLMHIFWLGLWVTVFKHNLAFPTVAAIPCIAATTFICCFVTTKIISLIPGSKWIIG